jgi:hypothetical protein
VNLEATPLIVTCSVLFLFGCASEPSLPMEYYALNLEKATEPIATISPITLANVFKIEQGDLESAQQYDHRKKVSIDAITNRIITIEATKDDLRDGMWRRSPDYKDMVVYRPFSVDANQCRDLQVDVLARSVYSYQICNVTGRFTNSAFLISREDARGIQDIENLGLAVRGQLAFPYHAYNQSYTGYVFHYDKFFMKDPSIVVFDKRSRKIINAIPF